MTRRPYPHVWAFRALWAESARAAASASVNFSAGTTSQNLSAVTFANSNGVSFGLNGGTITASVAPVMAASINLSAGTTSNLASAFTFSNSNGVSFGLNASTLTASVATSLTAVNVSAGTTSNNLSALTLSNANNVSFGLAGSVVTASATVASTQGSVNLSAGTTSNLASAFTFSNSNGVSFGLNAGTITASVASVAGASVSIFSQDADFVTNFSAVHGGMSLQRLSLPMNLGATKLIALLDLEGSSNSSGAMTLSHAVYTMSGSTASLASSASRQFTWASGSATSASSQYGGASGTRYRTVSVSYHFTPGDYLFAWQIQTGNSEVWNVIGRAGVNVVGRYDGAETQLFLNGTSVSTFGTAFPNSVVATDTGYVRTGVPAMRQPGAILVGTV